MSITIAQFEKLFDNFPSTIHTFETKAEAQAWLESQPADETMIFSIIEHDESTNPGHLTD